MFTAKLIRHRWEYPKILNGTVRYVEIEDHFKMIFSHPDEMKAFQKWMKDNGGEYKFDRATNKNEGELPEKIKELFPEDVGACDVYTFYLLHVAGYSFHSVIADVSFKGEVYTKEDEDNTTIGDLKKKK